MENKQLFWCCSALIMATERQTESSKTSSKMMSLGAESERSILSIGTKEGIINFLLRFTPEPVLMLDKRGRYRQQLSL